MKGTLIGTDYLEQGDSVKILEINTNTAIYHDGVDYLNFQPLFDTMVSNNITEFHYIYTELTSVAPSGKTENSVVSKLKQLCNDNNISYNEYIVPKNSITVPVIEDSDNKFILRQAFDTSAIVDSLYTADKFEFFSLMSGSSHIPKTYFSSSDDELFLDELSDVDYTLGNHPNLLEKSRYPNYDLNSLPKIFKVNSDEEVSTQKELLDSQDNLLQEFIYDDANVINNYYSTIRSYDVIFGSTLDILNLGAYKISSVVDMDFTPSTLLEATKEYNNKTRAKYITKNVVRSIKMTYHTDIESDILMADGTISNVVDLNIGDNIRTLTFDFIAGGPESGSKITEEFETHYGSIDFTSSSLQEVNSELISTQSQVTDVLMIEVGLETGQKWLDTATCMYYIEASGSDMTYFEAVNKFVVGDKILTYNKTNGELSKKEITSLDIVYSENQSIYNLDFEPFDYFLVDIDNDDFTIMHNVCTGCSWSACGNYWCDSSCIGCGFGSGGQK